MKIKDITNVIEAFAPLGAQEGFDNSGLLVGRWDDEVASVLVCVDVTEEVMDEAMRMGAGMVISHHPVIFHGLKSITGSTYIERVVAKAIREGIALYACHTNLDAVYNGMSYRLADILGIERPRLLHPTKPGDPTVGFGVVGELSNAVPTEEFLRMVMETLNLRSLRHSDIYKEEVRRVALCTGSGAGQIEDAIRERADVYLAAEFRYNNFLDAAGRIIIADVGHFESEYCAIDLLYDIITKKFPNFAVRKSQCSRNPVNYLV